MKIFIEEINEIIKGTKGLSGSCHSVRGGLAIIIVEKISFWGNAV